MLNKLFWEDFVPDVRELMGEVTVDLEEVVAFAKRYDPTVSRRCAGG